MAARFVVIKSILNLQIIAHKYLLIIADVMINYKFKQINCFNERQKEKTEYNTH